MIDHLNVADANWGKAKMSKAGKVVIINSILMATLIYYLSVYPIPDSVLTKISQISRKFLRANYDNGRGMPLVNGILSPLANLREEWAFEIYSRLSIP